MKTCGNIFPLPYFVESVQGNLQLRMDVYTHPELTNMVMYNGAAGGNGRRALRMYQKRFPNRYHAHHILFARLYQCLREDGSLRPRCIGGRPRQTRTPAFEEEMLERVGNDPSTSTRATAHAMGSNQSSVLRVLQEQNLHAFHLRKYKDWGPTTSHLVFNLSSGFCNGAS